MQIGIDSFAAAFDENSRAVNPADHLRQLIEQIEHADEVGLDAFGVGEHVVSENWDGSRHASLWVGGLLSRPYLNGFTTDKPSTSPPGRSSE